MDNYFKKYIESKLCLTKMINQIFVSYISLGDANKYNLDVSNSDIRFGSDLEVCSHHFSSDGMLAWNYLNIDKYYISQKELSDLKEKISNEEYDSNIDYYNEYLKIAILIIDLTLKNYSRKMSLEEALKNKIKFNPDLDELDRRVDVCYYLFESKEQNIWCLFGLEDSIIGRSVFENIRKELVKELLNNKSKVKELIKK